MDWKCIEFTMYYRCNADCVFCSHTVRMDRFREDPVSVQEIVDKLQEKKEEGYNHVTFTGGEPTLYPHFEKLLEIVKLLGFRTRAISNGWALSVDDTADKILPHLDELCLSIHGASEESHDRMTAAEGGFKRIKGALEMVRRKKPDINVIVNSVATIWNIDELALIANWVREYPQVSEYWISTLVAQGAGRERYGELSLPNVEVIARAGEIVAAAGRLPVRFYGFPLCVLGKFRERSTDTGRNPSIAIFRGRKKDGTADLREMESKKSDPPHVKTDKCKDCALADRCPGLWREYYRKFGDAELKTIKGGVAA